MLSRAAGQPNLSPAQPICALVTSLWRRFSDVDESAGVQFGHSMAQLFLRVHHNRTVPCNRLLDRLTRYQQEVDTLVARLPHDPDATVEEHQRVVTDIVHGRRIGFLDLLRQNRAWIRRIAEGARAHEHVGNSIARGLDFETLPLARGNRDIEVIRIGCRAFPTGPLFPQNSPQMVRTRVPRAALDSSKLHARKHDHARRAEIIYRNVRDGRIISATTTLLAT